MLDRLPTAPIAATALIAGYAVAVAITFVACWGMSDSRRPGAPRARAARARS